MLFEAFSSRKPVVVLDNLEDLQDETGELQSQGILKFLSDICRTSAPFHVVTTSQRPLGLPADFKGSTRILDIEDGLSPADSSVLLRTLDTEGEAGLRDADENTLRAAAGLLHGAPRGLELLEGLLEDPRSTLEIQDVLAEEGTPEQILSQLITTGYANLNDTEARVVQILAVAGVPIPRTAVASLLPELPSDTVDENVKGLIRRSLVINDKRARQIRLHPLDADYVRDKLLGPRPVLQDELHRRLAEWYTTQRTDPGSRRTLADITPQRREFAHRIAVGDRAGALSALADVAEFMARHGDADALRAADAVIRDGDPPEMRTNVYWCRGFAEFFTGSLTEALDAFTAAREIIGDAGADDRGPALDYWLGATLRHMGRAQAAVEVLERAVDATPDVTPRVRALFELGLAYCYLQNQSAAGSVVTRLEKLVSTDSPAIVRGQLHNLRVLVNLVTPDYVNAIAEVDEGLEFYRDTQQQDNEGFLWNLRGLAQLGAGEEDAAIEDLTSGRDCATKYGVLRLQGICWTNLAWALLRKGQVQEAMNAATVAARTLKLQGTGESADAELLKKTLESPPPSGDACRDKLAESVAGALGNPDFYKPSEQVLTAMANSIIHGPTGP
jgi:tetratricopeptide (TPR) repeat protein